MLNILSTILSPFELLETSNLLSLDATVLGYSHISMVPYSFALFFSFKCVRPRYSITKRQRCCHLSSNSGVNPSEIKPLISYFNCDLEKDRILKENKNKVVVYR